MSRSTGDWFCFRVASVMTKGIGLISWILMIPTVDQSRLRFDILHGSKQT